MSWDEYADGWDEDEAVRAYSRAAFACLEQLAADGRCRLDGARALDFGCGTGLLTERLAPRCEHVIALDTSVAMVRVLEGKVSSSGLDNVSALTRPLAEAVESRNELFTPKLDLVVASSVLAFVDDYAATVKQLSALLGPGGALVHFDWELDESAEEPFGLDAATVRETLKAAGLVDVLVEPAFAVDLEGQVMRPLLGYGRRA